MKILNASVCDRSGRSGGRATVVTHDLPTFLCKDNAQDSATIG